MSQNDEIQGAQYPDALSWVEPDATDYFGWVGLGLLVLVLFLVVYLYAVFDRYAERKGQATPFKTTIPTLLTLGLAYDLVPPLREVSLLLPLSLILAALARDLVAWLGPVSKVK